jgi:predicted DNA-binding antitoxin AbrB/MazE fold protein
MTKQIEAVYEQGIFRPLHPVTLSEGEVVEIILLKRLGAESGKRVAEILAEIAALPEEAPKDGFSGADHDAVLYGAKSNS